MERPPAPRRRGTRHAGGTRRPCSTSCRNWTQNAVNLKLKYSATVRRRHSVGRHSRRTYGMASLGELERAVMDLLWAGQEAATANTLRDLLAQSSAAQGGPGHEGKELAVTTVLTVLSRLEKKGLVA